MWLKNLAFISLVTLTLTGIANWLLLPPDLQEVVSRPISARDNFAQTLNRIDQQFATTWEDKNLEVAPTADDLTLARRISLGLTGTVPSLEEIRLLEQRPAEDRLAWWVDYLLEDKRFGDYFSERLSRAYVGLENGPFLIFRKRRFEIWLSEQLMDERPYDEIVREMIAEDGIWTDQPAVNFVTATVDQDGTNEPDVARLAGRVTRAFLATRIDCVQCHDDNLGGDLKQTDFHELASFFREAKNSFVGITDRRDSKYEFQYLGEEETVEVPAQVPFNQELLVADGETLRDRLANWVTHPENRPFSRALVNRVWGVMTGRPLVQPVDDIPRDGSFEEGDFPAGLEPLAEDFTRSGYDLKRLIRLIVASKAFQRDSRAMHEITTEHEKTWAAFPVTRLRPEQVIGSINQASSLHTIDAESHVFIRLVTFGETEDFLKRYGDAGEDEFRMDSCTIPQRLLMMNGNLVKDRTTQNFYRKAATGGARLSPSDQIAVETAFLSVLTRRPTEQELSHFVSRIRDNDLQTPEVQDFEDLYWALMNCTEFAWNH